MYFETVNVELWSDVNQRKIKERWFGYVHYIKRLVGKVQTNTLTAWDEDYRWNKQQIKNDYSVMGWTPARIDSRPQVEKQPEHK